MLLIGYISVDTSKAILFDAHYWIESSWLPKSQITIFREIDTHEVRVQVESWLASKNNWSET